jgi:hypothetical protein
MDPDPEYENGSGSTDPIESVLATLLYAINMILIFSLIFYFRFDETGEPFRCCGLANCASLSEKVHKILDPDVLEIQIGLRYRDHMDNSEARPESFRFVAYRNLFILTYGRTRAREERKPLPSCLVMKVRSLFPDPENRYTGFKAKRSRRK